MKVASTKTKGLGRAAGWALVVVAALRLVIPVSPAGYWRSSYFDCLRSADMVGEFHDGTVRCHLLPWAESVANSDKVETHFSGSYRRSGRSSFVWNQSAPKDSHELALAPGWLFCRIIDPQSGQVWWAIREFSWGRLRRLQAR